MTPASHDYKKPSNNTVVHKYNITHYNKRLRLDIPQGGVFRSVLADENGVYAYFEVPVTDATFALVTPRYVLALFTGHEADLTNSTYIGTIKKDGLVAHVYEVPYA